MSSSTRDHHNSSHLLAGSMFGNFFKCIGKKSLEIRLKTFKSTEKKREGEKERKKNKQKHKHNKNMVKNIKQTQKKLKSAWGSSHPAQDKEDFLFQKGLSQSEVSEALRRALTGGPGAPGPSQGGPNPVLLPGWPNVPWTWVFNGF